jgi:hypothetical protein
VGNTQRGRQSLDRLNLQTIHGEKHHIATFGSQLSRGLVDDGALTRSGIADHNNRIFL